MAEVKKVVTVTEKIVEKPVEVKVPKTGRPQK
jgi:hypothetical protein